MTIELPDTDLGLTVKEIAEALHKLDIQRDRLARILEERRQRLANVVEIRNAKGIAA